MLRNTRSFVMNGRSMLLKITVICDRLLHPHLLCTNAINLNYVSNHI